jgi:hypothetical protein
MRATCPECGAQAHVAAFFVEDDGKRLAVAVAGMAPELGRATLAYLGLFKPAKTTLRIARAAKIAQEVADLVAAGSVCKDERSGVRRPATPQQWALGMETMLAQRASLSLPLESHGYLRAVVYGLADKVDAAAERQREADARVGKHLRDGSDNGASKHQETPFERHMAWIAQTEHVGGFTPEEAEAERAKARAKYGERE